MELIALAWSYLVLAIQGVLGIISVGIVIPVLIATVRGYGEILWAVWHSFMHYPQTEAERKEQFQARRWIVGVGILIYLMFHVASKGT